MKTGDLAMKNSMLGGTTEFKLGLFSANCSGGLAVTKVPERWDNSWENNLLAAKLAEDAGFDFLLPIARWIGYGGETNFHGSVLETTTWATALLAHTEKINVFSTIHTAFNHPVVVAKQLATMDHVGSGRVGINIVAGWNRPEYEALGGVLAEDHESRYRYAQEWFEVIKKLWTEPEPFEFAGEFWQLDRTYTEPKPLVDAIPIINAAGSGQGREFAARNADFLFTTVITLEDAQKEIAAIKQQAAALGRSIDVMTLSSIFCRPTRAEAQEYYRYIVDNADEGAIDNIVRIMFANAESFPKDALDSLRERFAAGHGGWPLIGTPDDCADGLEQMAKHGLAGTVFGFVDYNKEIPYFKQEVLPRLERKGLRLAK
jgi:alkanesulfonate monooxygenase SsuD/methylene tetrahydromethanopterin reductase-like flavin-dependent oxidoreductase (luciferase family)